MTEAQKILTRLGAPANLAAIGVGGRWQSAAGSPLTVRSPIDGAELAAFAAAQASDVAAVVRAAGEAFRAWRLVPAPRRGELVRRLGERLRQHKADLAHLVSLEVGKITQESLGEVQEMIDVCDFAVGLSRQLYGLTIASERPEHRLAEQWHPLGPVGVITAFNFPVAVWAWNAMIALVCGDPVVWKPSEKTPLCGIACHAIAAGVAAEMPDVPEGLLGLLIGGGQEVGQAVAADVGLPLVSATGSVPMGRAVGQMVAARLGRALLELGGNNAVIVTDDANQDLALRAVLFGAVGTAGQRCTTTRRLILQRGIAREFTAKLVQAYRSVRIGDPLDERTLMGPLINRAAVEAMLAALRQAREQGGEVLHGGNEIDRPGHFVEPTLVRVSPAATIVKDETFAPILYIHEFDGLEQALQIHNDVPQGLSSSIFTTNLISAETFLSHHGSDCGIANVNVGTSGAEIGGAFGGEKETGGGRESGSDSWKWYMRRQTNTINWGSDMPLAQGVRFDL